MNVGNHDGAVRAIPKGGHESVVRRGFRFQKDQIHVTVIGGSSVHADSAPPRSRGAGGGWFGDVPVEAHRRPLVDALAEGVTDTDRPIKNTFTQWYR